MPLNEERWEARLEELRKFRREHGHCDVPKKHPGGLGRWVATQRTDRKQGKGWMDTRRIRKLDEEGFRWQVGRGYGEKKEDKWDARLEELKEFRREHGHCDVPQKHPGGLGNWASQQRQARVRGTRCLDARRIRMLEEEGFCWASYDRRWDARLEELKEFRRERGHCDVPARHPGGLGIWVSEQRRDRRQGTSCLDARRIRLLEEEGFRWSVIEGKWDARLWRVGGGHRSRRAAAGGSGENEEEDERGGGAEGQAAPEEEREAGAIPSGETRASRGGLGEQGSAAESLPGETEGRSREDATARALRAVDELVKMYREAPESARWVRGANGWEI